MIGWVGLLSLSDSVPLRMSSHCGRGHVVSNAWQKSYSTTRFKVLIESSSHLC